MQITCSIGANSKGPATILALHSREQLIPAEPSSSLTTENDSGIGNEVSLECTRVTGQRDIANQDLRLSISLPPSSHLSKEQWYEVLQAFARSMEPNARQRKP